MSRGRDSATRADEEASAALSFNKIIRPTQVLSCGTAFCGQDPA
jgi:hypothetical protein